MKQEYKITLDIPDSASKKDIAEYIEDAICGWKGGLDPVDPVTDLNTDFVKVEILCLAAYEGVA